MILFVLLFFFFLKFGLVRKPVCSPAPPLELYWLSIQRIEVFTCNKCTTTTGFPHAGVYLLGIVANTVSDSSRVEKLKKLQGQRGAHEWNAMECVDVNVTAWRRTQCYVTQVIWRGWVVDITYFNINKFLWWENHRVVKSFMFRERPDLLHVALLKMQTSQTCSLTNVCPARRRTPPGIREKSHLSRSSQVWTSAPLMMSQRDSDNAPPPRLVTTGCLAPPSGTTLQPQRFDLPPKCAKNASTSKTLFL